MSYAFLMGVGCMMLLLENMYKIVELVPGLYIFHAEK